MQQGKRAIVIGASSGIGLEVAKLLIKQGWKVGVAARRVELLQGIGASAVERIDVTANEASEALQRLIGKTGGMDLFFYASGIGKQNRELKEDIELATMQTNGVGFTRMIGEAYRYSATKAMQNVYLQALEQQALSRKLNIHFTDIRPGFVDTALLRGDLTFGRDGSRSTIQTEFDGSRSTAAFHYPMMMQPEEVAKEIVYAINHKKHIRIIDWKYRVLTALWRKIPRWLWRRFKL